MPRGSKAHNVNERCNFIDDFDLLPNQKYPEYVNQMETMWSAINLPLIHQVHPSGTCIKCELCDKCLSLNPKKGYFLAAVKALHIFTTHRAKKRGNVVLNIEFFFLSTLIEDFASRIEDEAEKNTFEKKKQRCIKDEVRLLMLGMKKKMQKTKKIQFNAKGIEKMSRKNGRCLERNAPKRPRRRQPREETIKETLTPPPILEPEGLFVIAPSPD